MCSIEVNERMMWHHYSIRSLNGSEPDSIVHEKSAASLDRAACDVCGSVGENQGVALPITFMQGLKNQNAEMDNSRGGTSVVK
jgi:hypothetical protein